MAKNTNNADNPNNVDYTSNTKNIIISRTETIYCIIGINNKDLNENSIENLSETPAESPETHKISLDRLIEGPKDSYIINIQNIFRSEYTEQRRNNKFNK
jgi:hypothetical protein